MARGFWPSPRAWRYRCGSPRQAQAQSPFDRLRAGSFGKFSALSATEHPVAGRGFIRQRRDDAAREPGSARRRIRGDFLRRRTPALRRSRRAVRVRLERRPRHQRTSDSRRRHTHGRRPGRADPSDKGREVQRQRGRRRRAGHGDRDGRAELRPRAAAVGVQGVRKRRAPEDYRLRQRERADRADCRDRHQRQHGAGDGEAEEGGPGISGGRSRRASR